MKKVFFVAIFAVISTMFAAQRAVAQFQSQATEPAHVVHYEGSAKLDTHRPDFRGVLMAIDMREPFRTSAFNKLRELGVTDFVEGKLPCKSYKEPVVCIQGQIGGSINNISTSSYSSGYRNGGGSSNGASFSGSLTDLLVVVTLNQPNSLGQTIPFYLGSSNTLAPSGTSTEYISSSSGTSSGSFGYTVTSGLDGAIVKAINDDLTGLFVSGHSFMGAVKRLGANKVFGSPWSPGADLQVATTFAKKTNPAKDPAAQ